MNPAPIFSNFMLQDWARAGLAALIFGALLILPGSGLAWIANALDFRQQARLRQLAIGLLAGLSLLPVLMYWLARWTGFWLTWIGLGLLAAIGLWTYRRRPAQGRMLIEVGAWVVLWTALALFLLSDLQIGSDRLYPSWTYGDYALRVPFTTAITQGGLPPVNLAYSPGKPVRLFYYYFWPMLCSLVDQAGGGLVGARDAVDAGTVWIGLGLAAAFYLVLRAEDEARKPGRLVFILLLVGGLDLLLLGLEGIITSLTDRSALVRNAALFLGTTGWNHAALVETWPNAVLWVPHHVASLLAGAFAGLLLTRPMAGGKRSWGAPILAGLSLASAAGYSLWVALVLACALLAFFGLSIWPRHGEWITGRQRRAWLASGVVAGLAILPFALDLMGSSQPGGFPLGLYIRPFEPAHRLLAALWPQAGPGLSAGLDLLLLPFNYAIEFGFVALLAWIGRRNGQAQPTPLDLLLGALFWSSLLISSFLRSTVLNNDLAWRGILPAQFVLLIWAARSPAASFSFWRDPTYSKLLRGIWCLALVLGLGASSYDLLSVRAYGLLKERLEEPGFGKIYFAIRQARQAIEVLLPPGGYVQASPDVSKDFHFGLYNTHPALIADRYVLNNNRIPERESRPLLDEILAAFGAPEPEKAVALCQRYHLSALLFSAWDPTWERSPWQAAVPVVFANAYARVVTCGDLAKWSGLAGGAGPGL